VLYGRSIASSIFAVPNVMQQARAKCFQQVSFANIDLFQSISLEAKTCGADDFSDFLWLFKPQKGLFRYLRGRI
jgi:hypothetical protein